MVRRRAEERNPIVGRVPVTILVERRTFSFSSIGALAARYANPVTTTVAAGRTGAFCVDRA